MNFKRNLFFFVLFLFFSKASCQREMPFETYIGENQKRYFKFEYTGSSIDGFAVGVDKGEKERPEVMWVVDEIGAYKKDSPITGNFIFYYGEDFSYERSKVSVAARPLEKGKEYFIVIISSYSDINKTRYYFTH
ncbi:MAG TPA: hypothetical protein PKA14_24475 [Leptospiraceae bacterium]|nr:hypothetical protein [Leptospiraceae bacterium]